MVTEVIQGDARSMPFLDDDSVDLIVTSPPYWGLRSYRDAGEHYDGQVGSEDTPRQFVAELVAMIDSEWRRVLKPVGNLWLNLGDKYAGGGGFSPASPINLERVRTGAKAQNNAKRNNISKDDSGKRALSLVSAKSLMGLPWRVALQLIDRGWTLRAEVIWSKPNGLPDPAPDRVQRSHEQWFHFTLRPRYFSAVDEIREPHVTVGGETLADRKARNDPTAHRNIDNNLARPGPTPKFANSPLGRLPKSVWTIPTEPLIIPDGVREQLGLVDHFAAFPQEWPRRIIKAFAPEGGVVLDPFGGTGTTAGVARTLGRTGISVDLSEDYCNLARWRIFKSGHFSKTEQRTWADKQTSLL